MDTLVALFMYVFGTPTPPTPVELYVGESVSEKDVFSCNPAVEDCDGNATCTPRELPKVTCVTHPNFVGDVWECCMTTSTTVKCCNNFEQMLSSQKGREDDGVGPTPPHCSSY